MCRPFRGTDAQAGLCVLTFPVTGFVILEIASVRDGEVLLEAAQFLVHRCFSRGVHSRTALHSSWLHGSLSRALPGRYAGNEALELCYSLRCYSSWSGFELLFVAAVLAWSYANTPGPFEAEGTHPTWLVLGWFLGAWCGRSAHQDFNGCVISVSPSVSSVSGGFP